MKLVRVQAVEADAQLILTWRNDPLTRSMSYHQEEKKLPGFMNEFVSTYFAEESLPPLFGEIDGQRVGFLRFRVYDDPLPAGISRACDISVMVGPDHRGKGVGRKLVLLGTGFVHQRGWPHVIAEVKPENAASLRLFAGAGYQKLDVHQRTFDDLPQPVTVVRFVHRKDA